jgi:hypothetical protein
VRDVRLGLVGDVKAKGTRSAPARDLFESKLFQARRDYADQHCNIWFVLSAMYGLLHPDQVVAPYERTLAGAPRATKEQWSNRVLWQLDQAFADWRDVEVELHAGSDHRNFGLHDGLLDRGATVVVPAERMGGGEQLAFYAAAGVIDLTDPVEDAVERVLRPSTHRP